MKTFLKSKSIYLIVLIFFIGTSLILLLKKSSEIEILKLDHNDLINYFKENNLDTSFIDSGIQSKALIVFPKSTHYYLKVGKDVKDSLLSTYTNDQPVKEQIQNYLQDQFLLFTEEVTIKERSKLYMKLPFFLQKGLIEYGFWSPLCGEISSISSKLVLSKIRNITRSNIIKINSLNHIISGLYYQDSLKSYAIAVDFQNGFIGPVDSCNHRVLTIEELIFRVENNNYEGLDLEFLNENILINKKTLIPTKYTDNIFPENKLRIFEAKPFHRYLTYRKTYSTHYYLWFYLGLADKPLLIREIMEGLYQDL